VTLREKIEQEIAVYGSIPFSRYMEVCLYDPEFGYYSRNSEQFGKAGDFYTSSDVHAVFGRLLVRQFEEMWRVLGKPKEIEVLELGAGRGLFARDVLDWSSKKFPDFFSALHYSLLEQSPALRERLKTTLANHLERNKASILHSEAPDETEAKRRKNAAQSASPGSGTEEDKAGKGRKKISRTKSPDTPLIIFANEFFDALPVEILSSQGSLHLANALSEIWMPTDKDQLGFLDRYGVHPELGERLEVPLIAQHYAAEIASSIQRGFLIAIDYGYTGKEQLTGRHRGTLMTYRQHSAGINPYQAPGEQDITAHVNFTALAAAVQSGGLSPHPLVTQSQFLLGIGESNQFADAFEECRLPQERAKVALQLKHLIAPEGMGESFRVLVASKGVDVANVSVLAGLSFGRTRRD
jgi:SAM-dependent MidA family methyltransferase